MFLIPEDNIYRPTQVPFSVESYRISIWSVERFGASGVDQFMSETVVGAVNQQKSAANGVLRAAGGFWFLVMLAGQWLFFYYIAAFYGTTTFSGNFEAWNRLEVIGRTPYVPGDTAGNLAYAAHALAAGIIAFGGALQLIPQIRKHAPTFHRWNGRLFLLTVTGLSLSGFYLVWVRHAVPGLVDSLSVSFNGVLILTFAGFALKNAMARNIDIHRRWAMRLYLVSNAQWFIRVGFFGYFVVSQLVGHEASDSDPFISFWTFGCYLVPLAVLELYMRAKDRGGSLRRLAIAGLLFALTLLMIPGIFAYSMFSRALITGEPLGLPG